jgi:hypothetical protein
MPDPIPEELLRRIEKVTNKRARFVLDHIVANGQVTNEELNLAGYNHPPRAARDVRELGFALKTIKVKHSDGRTIGAYIFDFEGAVSDKGGRQMLPKKERDALLLAAGNKCQICSADTNLQVDHRVPYEVAGESQSEEENPYLILDGACNRKKSWSCEHCRNWLELKEIDVCKGCYWAYPENYSHVAMTPERRIDVVWLGDEVGQFETLKEEAHRNGRSVADEIKQALASKQKP